MLSYVVRWRVNKSDYLSTPTLRDHWGIVHTSCTCHKQKTYISRRNVAVRWMFYTDPRYELSIKKVWQVSLPKVTMHDFYTL